MLENIKWYLINVGMKKYVPVGLMAALAAVGTFMAAHAGMLEQYGVTYGVWPFVWPVGQEPSGACLLIEMDTLSKAAIAGVFAVVAMVSRAAEHHTVGVLTVPGTAQPSTSDASAGQQAPGGQR